MPGRIMTAQEAMKHYDFKSIKKSGSKITLKNSTGKKTTVDKNKKVYHRGKGKFGIYSQTRDYHRGSKYHTPGGKQNVGKGSYRQTRD